MRPNYLVSDGQRTGMIYHWKCQSYKCTADHRGKTNGSLTEIVLDHRNQTTSAIRNNLISTKYPGAEPKDFTVIDRKSTTLHCQAKEALHICI